jgi:transposase
LGRCSSVSDELERQVDRDSANSSNPPSSDAPKSRAERRRLAREAYKRSMRKSGGQPGHEGKTRDYEMVAPQRIDERRVHLPQRCDCGHEFDGWVVETFSTIEKHGPPIRGADR